jgi:outer membrane protein OmpA-like peptidoglycan-associated protein
MARASYGKARRSSLSGAVAACLVALSCLVAPLARPAIARADEPWLLAFDGVGAVSLNEPQTQLFGPGAALAASVYRPLTPYLLVGGRLRLGLLSDGDPPTRPHQLDPSLGGISSLSAALRLRLAGFGRDDGSRATGVYVELALGAGLTGSRVRFAPELGAGWLFRVGPIDVGPTVRFTQLVESDDALDERDARLLLFGVEVVLFDPRGHTARPVLETRPVLDTDHDGLADPVDQCPEEPEDRDSFEDEDGCPDLDNDQDRVRDADDRCPLVPEDRDGFEDEDGCPDPDNDGDGILDGVDQCPNDAEIVNGVDDEDGCPDEGLIALVDDRIVLEETVLFDFERSRVKSSARPVLHAIVQLVLLHPEWTRVRIEGHADARGDTAFNQELSERRAVNVREALVALGVPAGIIDSAGYGATRPRDTRETELGYQRNRRVEFVVLARRGAPTAAATDAPPTVPGASTVPESSVTPAPGGTP